MTIPAKGRPDPRRRETLWTRVDRNRFRLAVYLAFFTLVSSTVIGACLSALGFVLALIGTVDTSAAASWLFANGWLRPWGFGVAASVLYEWWALSRSEKWLLRRLGAQFVDKGFLLDTKMALKDMRLAAGMPMSPALYLMATGSVNAFVFKAPGRRPVLGVTGGFVERLSVDEQRAVFANLVARVVSGDTMVSSAVAALMTPLQWYRLHRLQQLEDEDVMFAEAGRQRQEYVANYGDSTEDAAVLTGAFALAVMTLPFVFPALLLGEVVAAVQRRSQLTASEKADAEGMLLLKDPAAMLSALERCVVADNVVVAAGESLGDLFYCWTGDSPDDDTDPEWERVARLREVLGVEGMVSEDLPEADAELFAPPPPRVKEDGEGP